MVVIEALFEPVDYDSPFHSGCDLVLQLLVFQSDFRQKINPAFGLVLGIVYQKSTKNPRKKSTQYFCRPPSSDNIAYCTTPRKSKRESTVQRSQMWAFTGLRRRLGVFLPQNGDFWIRRYRRGGLEA